MLALLNKISALGNVAKFLPIIQGTTLTLNNGITVVLKLKSSQSLTLRPGLRFSKYSFQTYIEANGIVESGQGEGPSKLIAFQKSMAEGVERAIFRITKNSGAGTDTTSGWAAHVSRAKAENAAIEELAERDALLLHWLLKKPMLEISPASFPKNLQRWVDTELSLNGKLKTLKILMTFDGFVPTATTILQSEEGLAVMSHATAPTLYEAIEKAMAETCRLASNLDGQYFFDSSRSLISENPAKVNPQDHAMLYAYHHNLPRWLFGEQLNWNEASKRWHLKGLSFDKTAFEFQEVLNGSLVVGFAKSKLVQELYFGATSHALQNGKINLARLNLVGGAGQLNLAPHFIS